MANMAKKNGPGDYQIGIYSVKRSGRVWSAFATGPGTVGSGFAGFYRTLAAAHASLTGEPMRAA